MSGEPQVDRRRFLKVSGASTAVAVASVTTPSEGNAAAKDDSIGLGFVGVGGRGSALLGGFMQRKDCRVVALCDPHRTRLAAASQQVNKQTGAAPDTHVDVREMLKNPAIGAVVVATPDHWHVPATVLACQAGKHVYVEKPVSHNIWEGRQAVKAARRYDRVVQVGLQNRSAPYNHEARDYIESGKLGKIVLCRVYNQKNRGAFQLAPDSEPPEHLAWDLWNGPCVNTAFNTTRHTHWHDFWDTSGGDVGNDGVHQVDLACMLLGIETLPKSVYTVGFRREESAAQTPDTAIITFEFDDYPLTFHQTEETPYMLKTDGGVRNSDMFPYWQQNATRIEIFGTEGVMFVGRHGGGWQVFARPKSRRPVVAAQRFGRFPDPEHKEDFIQAIRNHRRPSADIEHGHRSAALCHMANISYRVGNKLLYVDREAERFTNNEEANALLKREYREPFVVPEQV